MNQPIEEHQPILPGQNWHCELFEPRHAEGVARLFLSVYGRGYPIRAYIEPQLLIEENAAGRIISCVAVTDGGDVVGHESLFRIAGCDRVYETGAGAVDQAYRGGRGIFTEMHAFLERTGPQRFPVEVIFGESVCNHIISQKMCLKFGYVTCAVEVDLMPAAAYEKEQSAVGRVASLADFHTLVPKCHRVFIPPVYAEQLDFIYRGLDDKRDIQSAGGAMPPAKPSRIEQRHFDFAQVTRMAAFETGSDFATVFQAAQTHARDRGSAVIQVWLNLAEPWIDATVAHLRKKGYFCGGVLPRWLDTDALLMTRIFHRPSWEQMQILSDRSKAIVAMARADWEKTLV